MKTAIVAVIVAGVALAAGAQNLVRAEPLLFLAVWPLAALAGFLMPPRGAWIPIAALAGGLAGIAARLGAGLRWEALVFAAAACLPLVAFAALRARSREERLAGAPILLAVYALGVWAFALAG